MTYAISVYSSTSGCLGGLCSNDDTFGLAEAGRTGTDCGGACRQAALQDAGRLADIYASGNGDQCSSSLAGGQSLDGKGHGALASNGMAMMS